MGYLERLNKMEDMNMEDMNKEDVIVVVDADESDQNNDDDKQKVEDCDDRTLESWKDEALSLRKEIKTKREDVESKWKGRMEEFESSMKAELDRLKTELDDTHRQLRLAKLKSTGIPDEKLAIIEKIEDESVALQVAELLASATTNTSKANSQDVNLKNGVRNAYAELSPKDEVLRMIKNKS